MLPSTFRAIHEGRRIQFVRAGYEEEVLRERSEAEAELHGRGRGAVRSFSLGSGGDRMLVRHCRRGGLLGRIVPDLFLGEGRVVNEIAVSERARDRGVPTALVLGARCDRVAGPFCRADVMTKAIPDGCDLIRYCESRGAAVRSEKRHVIASVARAIRAMHDAGVFHADLHLKNILIDADGAAYVLDLDRASMCESLGLRERLANLLRLDRSARKWKAARESVTTADRLRFLTAYAGGDANLRGACRRLFRRKRSYPFHRFFWKLMGIE